MADFSDLIGLILIEFELSYKGSGVIDRINLRTVDQEFAMYHSQDCCEDVYLYDTNGDVADLLDSPILLAEEVSNKDETGDHESATWTFYKIGTVKGTVTLRWLGVSNGYYSEAVIFDKVR